jgi:hypothetical protein
VSATVVSPAVVVVMHEGNVTQIETSEKIRLPHGRAGEA